jgi:hypothetical protein
MARRVPQACVGACCYIQAMPIQNDPMLAAIALVQVFNAMLVGGVAWYFAYYQKRIAEEQKRIAKEKLRLDLFDKRFAVFDAARKFVGRALVARGVEIEDQNAFLVGVAGASFLLNDDLSKYLDEILRRAIDLPFLHDELANAPTDDARNGLEARYLAERKWFREQTSALETKFKPFLQMDDE